MERINAIISPDDPLPPCDPRIGGLHRHWHKLYVDRGALPGRQHFDPLDVHRLLPWIWLVDVQREPLRFRFRLLGTEQVRAMECNPTGRWIDETFPHVPSRSPTYAHFIAAVAGKIAYRRGFPVVYVPKDYILTERIFLPLARDGSTVDMLLALTVYHSANAVPDMPGRPQPPLSCAAS